MKIRSAKRIISILLVILLTTFCTISITAIISFVNKNPAQKDIEAAADLTISDLAQLKAFANEVANGNTYSGETVVLGDDINCEWNTIVIGDYKNYFQGTFDGQGNTIYNLNIGQAINSSPLRTAIHQGFFGLTKNASILNLELENRAHPKSSLSLILDKLGYRLYIQYTP